MRQPRNSEVIAVWFRLFPSHFFNERKLIRNIHIHHYCNKDTTPCWLWLACDIIDIPACSKIFWIDNDTISLAMSVSLIWDSAAWVFSSTFLFILYACSNLFWNAPNSLRCEEIFVCAFFIIVIAFLAPLAEPKFTFLLDIPDWWHHSFDKTYFE